MCAEVGGVLNAGEEESDEKEKGKKAKGDGEVVMVAHASFRDKKISTAVKREVFVSVYVVV